jgi:hypothetical protein
MLVVFKLCRGASIGPVAAADCLEVMKLIGGGKFIYYGALSYYHALIDFVYCFQ